MTTPERGRGRPRAISREMLREAAFDLFLAQGYAATTIGEIARTAGVSRNTFFNYFTGKSDVFWTELDQARQAVHDTLGAADPAEPAMAAVRAALLAAADSFGPERVPWALTQHAFIDAGHELQASALTRLADLAGEVEAFLGARGRPLAGPAAYAVVAAAVASARSWAGAGTRRGPLRPYLDAAITPVCAAYAD